MSVLNFSETVLLDDLPLRDVVLTNGGQGQNCISALGLSGVSKLDDRSDAPPLTLTTKGLHINVWDDVAPLPKGEVPPFLARLIWGGESSVLYLCDTAALPGNTGLAAWPDLKAECLFSGDAADRLANVAPYLMPLTVDTLFTRRLFNDDGRFWSLWPHGCGIFLQSTVPIVEIRRNLRRFTKLMEGDRWVFLRLAEPRTLVALLLGMPPDLRGRLFKGIESIIAIDPDEGLAIKAQCSDPPGTSAPCVEPRLKAVLDAATRARFARQIVRFCQETLADRPAPEAKDKYGFGRAAFRAAALAGLHDRYAVLLASAAAWCAQSADASWISRQTDLIEMPGISQIEKARAMLRRAHQDMRDGDVAAHQNGETA